MLSIRLSRMGSKNAPSYRVVVMPKQRDPKARVTEILGHYNPRRHPRELVLKTDRIKYWLDNGAQATDTVWNLLVDEKIVTGKKRGVTNISKKRQAKLGEKEEAKKEAEVEAKKKAEEAKIAEAEAKEKAKAEAEEAKKAEAEAPAEEAPVEEVKTETEAVKEDKKEETPAE